MVLGLLFFDVAYFNDYSSISSCILKYVLIYKLIMSLIYIHVVKIGISTLWFIAKE